MVKAPLKMLLWPGWCRDDVRQHRLLPLDFRTVCVSISVSVGFVNTVGLTVILLHLLNALLHWTLLWFPLKFRQIRSN